MKKSEAFVKKVYYKLGIGKKLSTIERMFWKPYRVMDAKETIDYIVEKKCSVARFGDGEFSIAAYGCALGFQKADEKLQNSLIDVMYSCDQNLLLCLPPWVKWDDLRDEKKLDTLGPVHKNGIINNLHDWMKHFSKKKSVWRCLPFTCYRYG